MSDQPSPWRLGVDVGGTFTDAVLYNIQDGKIYRAKVPSTPHDQSQAVMQAVESIKYQLLNLLPHEIPILNHGTTVATNAILEGKGARVALLVTDGYKDILQLRRSQVPGGLAGWIKWPKPQPLVPLDMTIEVTERISTDGSVVIPLDEPTLRTRLKQLKQLAKLPESITVSLINSFANTAHELQVARIVQEELPGIPISLSSNVSPEIMEYERTMTTVVNAYVKPVMDKYLTNLASQLENMGLRVLRSDGGLSSVEVAKNHCSNLLYSGPAGGVAGIVKIVASKGPFKNLLTFDMGGTSTDVCLVENGIPSFRRESTIGVLTVRAPCIDVRTVGAGGGSIATVSEITRALRVGPESAGACPGPACYSKGGDLPTVTDAFLVLGYLPPTLLGGSFKLDTQAAWLAIEEYIAKPMGITVLESAEGIIHIAIEKMYGSLRSVSIEKGRDPANFNLVSFGGAGGLVACELSKLCGTVYPTIVPPSPGVLCAFGDASTTVKHEVSASILRRLSDLNLNEIHNLVSQLQKDASATLVAQGIPSESQKLRNEMDLRYRGQATCVPVFFDHKDISKTLYDVVRDRFKKIHEELYTFSLDAELEIVSIRVSAEEIMDKIATTSLKQGDGNTEVARHSTTTLFYSGKQYPDVSIFDRSMLFAGDTLPGPCIILEPDSNTLITPDHEASIDLNGNILIWPKSSVSMTKSLSSRLKMDTPQSILIQLVEASMSPAMREQLDYFPMIAAGEGPHMGKMVCGQFGSFIPGFLLSWDETIDEGDVFITNDPYSVNNAISHLNDFLIVTPVHFQGKIVAWVANLGHFTDIGSIVPGSMPNCATTIFEEGLQVPICKIYSRGVPNLSVFRIIERNSRKPNFAMFDLQALIAATKIGSGRVIEMCKRFGIIAYEDALDALLNRNKIAISKLIETTIGDDPVFFEDFIDDDGFGSGPWRIACTMYKQIQTDKQILVFDFDGTDPQSNRSINFALSHEMLKMFIAVYLLTVFDPTTIVNDGSFDLIKVIIPCGTILNPIRPAALSCRTHLLGRLFDVIGALFGQRQPEFLSAAGYSDSPHFFYSGWTEEGEWFQIGFGGIPARPHGDGPDGHSMWPSMKSVPNEYLESSLPLRVDRYETIPDSGGEGFYRGGNGIRIVYTFLANGNVSLHDDRWFTKPWGVNGGGVGGRSRKVLVKYSIDPQNPPKVVLGSKEDFIKVSKYDVLEWMTWGGGGWGSPLERDPYLVAKEVREGLVKDASRYGVVLDSNNKVDEKATKSARRSMAPAQEVLSRHIFNRGGTLKEIREKCFEETGLIPPNPPSARVLEGLIAHDNYIAELHGRRRKEDAALYDD